MFVLVPRLWKTLQLSDQLLFIFSARVCSSACIKLSILSHSKVTFIHVQSFCAHLRGSEINSDWSQKLFEGWSPISAKLFLLRVT